MRKFIAGAVTTFLFVSNSALAYSVEANFWKERKKTTQLASLPTDAMGMSGSFHLPQATPSFDPAATLKKFENQLSQTAVKKLAPVLSSLSHRYGNVRNITLSNNKQNKKIVIHIQDVHANVEAQQNIGATIQELIENGTAELVALEGGFGPIDLSRFKAYPYQNSVQKAADYLLKELRISGSIHAALSTQSKLPPVIGVDHLEHYEANVAAYRNTSEIAPQMKEAWAEDKNRLKAQKENVFGLDLMKFDQMVDAYRSEELPMADFIRHAVKLDAGFSKRNAKNIASFLNAMVLEEKLNIDLIEAQREKMIGELVKKLGDKQMDSLLDLTVAFRLGQVGSSDFYKKLKSLCEKYSVPLNDYPDMNDYIQYLILADGIDSDQLFKETGELEKSVYASLAKTEQEKKLIKASKEHYLAGQLINFAMTPEEWAEHKAGKRKDLEKFETFYKEAELRDIAISSNLMKAMDQHKADVAVLVTGGFHSEGIINIFKNQEDGPAVITFAPQISYVEGDNGVGYLSVFTQQKTPLEQLFEGDQLFVSQKMWPPVVERFAALTTVAYTAISEKVSNINQLFRNLVLATAVRLEILKQDAFSVLIRVNDFRKKYIIEFGATVDEQTNIIDARERFGKGSALKGKNWYEQVKNNAASPGLLFAGIWAPVWVQIIIGVLFVGLVAWNLRNTFNKPTFYPEMEEELTEELAIKILAGLDARSPKEYKKWKAIALHFKNRLDNIKGIIFDQGNVLDRGGEDLTFGNDETERLVEKFSREQKELYDRTRRNDASYADYVKVFNEQYWLPDKRNGFIFDTLNPLTEQQFVELTRNWDSRIGEGIPQLLRQLIEEYEVHILTDQHSDGNQWSDSAEATTLFNEHTMLKEYFGLPYITDGRKKGSGKYGGGRYHISHEIGYTKQDVEAYEHVLKVMNLEAHQVAFFDDKAEFVTTARRLGMFSSLIAGPNEKATQNFLVNEIRTGSWRKTLEDKIARQEFRQGHVRWIDIGVAIIIAGAFFAIRAFYIPSTLELLPYFIGGFPVVVFLSIISFGFLLWYRTGQWPQFSLFKGGLVGFSPWNKEPIQKIDLFLSYQVPLLIVTPFVILNFFGYMSAVWPTLTVLGVAFMGASYFLGDFNRIKGLLFWPQLDFGRIKEPFDPKIIRDHLKKNQGLTLADANKRAQYILEQAEQEGIKLTAKGHFRGFDGPGSSLDLPMFQLWLSNIFRWTGLKKIFDIPSTIPAANSMELEIEFEKASDPNVIEYVAPEYGFTEENPYRHYGQVPVGPDGKVSMKHAVGYIYQLFGVTGVKASVKNIDIMATVGGMESSNVFFTAVIASASILSGANLSKAEIFSLAVKLENDVFPGNTGGQGHFATLRGGVDQVVWLSGFRNRYAAFAIPALEGEETQKLSDHLLLAQAGLPYEGGDKKIPRLASLTNDMWTDLLAQRDQEVLPLFEEQLSVTAEYAQALRDDDFETVVRTVDRYVEIRDTYTQYWFKLLYEAIKNSSNKELAKSPKHAQRYFFEVFHKTYGQYDSENSKTIRDLVVQHGDVKIAEDGTPSLLKSVDQTELANQVSLYTYGPIRNLVKAAREWDGDGTIVVMPLGAGGPGSNLAVVSSEGTAVAVEFLKQNDINLIDKAKKADIGQIVRGEKDGVVKGYTPYEVGKNPMTFAGFDDEKLNRLRSTDNPPHFLRGVPLELPGDAIPAEFNRKKGLILVGDGIGVNPAVVATAASLLIAAIGLYIFNVSVADIFNFAVASAPAVENGVRQAGISSVAVVALFGGLVVTHVSDYLKKKTKTPEPIQSGSLEANLAKQVVEATTGTKASVIRELIRTRGIDFLNVVRFAEISPDLAIQFGQTDNFDVNLFKAELEKLYNQNPSASRFTPAQSYRFNQSLLTSGIGEKPYDTVRTNTADSSLTVRFLRPDTTLEEFNQIAETLLPQAPFNRVNARKVAFVPVGELSPEVNEALASLTLVRADVSKVDQLKGFINQIEDLKSVTLKDLVLQMKDLLDESTSIRFIAWEGLHFDPSGVEDSIYERLLRRAVYIIVDSQLRMAKEMTYDVIDAVDAAHTALIQL